MTRINVVPVEELSDNFLLAEFFELPRMWPLIYRAIQKNDRDIPETYRLGAGHLRFFYDKITYLDARHSRLWHEGKRRGLNLQKDPNIHIWYQDVVDLTNTSELLGEDPLFWFKDYEPTPEAIQLNRDRLQYRRRYDGGVYG